MRTRRRGRTASTAATCATACLPVPRTAKSSASGAASQRVATPEAPPVRICPRAKASMTALSEPFSESNRMSSGHAPPSVCAQVFVPTKPSCGKVAPMACRVEPPPHAAWVLTMFCASPRASKSSPFSSASMASPMSMRATTSCSLIQIGDVAAILSLPLQRRADRRLQPQTVGDERVHHVAADEHQDADRLLVPRLLDERVQLAGGAVPAPLDDFER